MSDCHCHVPNWPRAASVAGVFELEAPSPPCQRFSRVQIAVLNILSASSCCPGRLPRGCWRLRLVSQVPRPFVSVFSVAYLALSCSACFGSGRCPNRGPRDRYPAQHMDGPRSDVGHGAARQRCDDRCQRHHWSSCKNLLRTLLWQSTHNGVIRNAPSPRTEPGAVSLSVVA